MAILKIIKDEDPMLRKTSRRVDDITLRILRLLDDMTETMRDANGCGLAAVQVGILRRIVVIEAEPGKVLELINPEIIKAEGKQNEMEGCLSLPSRWGITDRPAKVTVRALNREGKALEVVGEDLLARALCHEIDHLDGKLFIDNAIRMLTSEEVDDMTSEE